MYLPVEQLHSRAESLVTKFEQGGGRSYIDEAIDLDREALQLCAPDHPERYISLIHLAHRLLDRYKQIGATSDFEGAIILGREALGLCPQGHPARLASLNNLAIGLSTRHKRLGGMEDLNEAIVLDREVLALCPQGHPNRSMALNNLGVRLSARYMQLGEIGDLEEAIVVDREALDLCPRGHPNRSLFVNNLAVRLSARYTQLGGMEDLDEAIVLDREALGLRPQDLDEAIALDREALGIRPQGNPDWSMSVNNLAAGLSSRYNLLKRMEDLDEAIVLGRVALNLRPQGHPDRSMAVNNLAVFLFTRNMQLGRMEDLDEATALYREALNLRPKGHPDRSASLNDLALSLSARCRRLGAMEDLDEAVVLGREALDLSPQGHSLRSYSLITLASHLSERFTYLRQVNDIEEAFSLYTQLAHLPQFVSTADFTAAREWIRMAHDFQHPTILLAYETSLQLLTRHLATLPSLPQHLDLFKNLTSSLAVDAFSACLRERAPAHAVELLEQGRGVFWTQLNRLRSPLDDLTISSLAGKTLADEFMQLTLLIRNALKSPGADQHERLCHLNFEMHRVVTKVRDLPGFSRFLLPSLFPDLQHAASGGPVIIVNASKYSCDAVIILLDRDPVHIPLDITQEGVRDLSTELRTLIVRARRFDATRALAAFLRKLWDQIVSPIVDSLQMIHPSQSRIWWCPTAEFSALPFHAAGPFRKDSSDLSSSATELKRFIAIGQATADGGGKLVSVDAELDIIGQRVDGLATFTRIDEEESRISRVVEELGKSNWVHLACHGLPNRKQPFESAFALRDGHFTIQRIIGCELKDPEFAYLSACHTTVGYEESPDEVIHLASAMQFAGFRSVIGTMWAVDDGETNKITSTFYRYMVDESGQLDHTRAAFALNKTMKFVDDVPFDQQILYIHLGAYRIDFSSAGTDDLEALYRACKPAEFGRNGENVLDDSYRKAGKMDLTSFATLFDPRSLRIHEQATNVLLTQGFATMDMELYKLNVYGKGDFFKAHKDTPRGQDMFGSLVVVLPTLHEGGEFVLRQGEKEWTIDFADRFATAAEPSVCFVAFFSDIEHEVLPVKSGYRVTLTYNLYHKPVHPSTASIPTPFHLKLKQALVDLVNDKSNLPRGGYLGLGLVHQYIHTGRKLLKLLMGQLKGMDRVLANVCDELGLRYSLRLLYREIDMDPRLNLITTEELDASEYEAGLDDEPTSTDFFRRTLKRKTIKQIEGIVFVGQGERGRKPEILEDDIMDDDSEDDKSEDDKSEDDKSEDDKSEDDKWEDDSDDSMDHDVFSTESLEARLRRLYRDPVTEVFEVTPMKSSVHVKTPFMVYGNDAELSYFYGTACMLIAVEPAESRQVLKF
ncbi:CHAT domain-containing protein [Boletus coccyginus]|nr:CHAT domain-containing protein [Boletus coccyginus]